MKIEKSSSSFSIGRKILFGFLIIIFIFGVTAIINYYQIKKIDDLREQVIPLSLQINSLQEFAISLESSEKNIDRFFRVGYKEDRGKANKDLEKMLEIISSLKNNSNNNSIVKLQEIEKQLSEIQANINYLANIELNSTNSKMINEKRVLVYGLIDSCRQKHRELLSEITQKLVTNVKDQKFIISGVIEQSLMIGISVMVLGVLISILIAKSISRPIEKLRDVTIEIGKGNFDHKINITSDDEVGELAHAFNKMAIDLHRLMEEHKRTEEIRIENGRLVSTNKAKSEFLANMSHELRTPLNAIIGFSELLKQKIAGELNEKQIHYIDNVIKASKHLLTLISDLLDLNKVEAGKLELNLEKFSLAEVINESTILIKEIASKHNIILKTQLDPKLEFMEADPLRFKQVLYNLLSNAVKFSKPEGGIVRIAAKKEGDFAKFSVSDTGIGIQKENIDKLFNIFEQFESVGTRHYGGSGLGLAISKKLVELHGGEIWAESTYGEGSSFTFTMPVISKNRENSKA